MQRYAAVLERELSARGVSVRLLRPAPVFGRLRPGSAGFAKWLGYLDKYLIFPRFLRRAVCKDPGAFVHICDHSNAVYLGAVGEQPNLVTCHDLLAVRSALGHFSSNRIKWSGRRLQQWILRGLKRASHVACVSEETRRQLLAIGGLDPGRCSVIPNGLNYPFRRMTEAESRAVLAGHPEVFRNAQRPYVFHVGGNQWYKNRAGVIRIYQRYLDLNPLGADLIMAGKPFTEEMRASLGGTVASQRVHDVGQVDNETLNALYSRAECLLFPSIEEGFGWPLIEAMASGCPVVTTNRPPMNAIGYDTFAYIDPSDEAGAARILSGILTETEERRASRRASGLKRAGSFSSENMGRAFLDLYCRLTMPAKAVQRCG